MHFSSSSIMRKKDHPTNKMKINVGLFAFCALRSVSVVRGECKERINHFRIKHKIQPLITEREDLRSCVDRQSEWDKQMGPHSSLKRCGIVGGQASGGGWKCENVIDMFYKERYKCKERTLVSGKPAQKVSSESKTWCRKRCDDDPKCMSFSYAADSDGLDHSCRFYNKLIVDSVPDNSSPWEYCRADRCGGHCGALLNPEVTTFSWGVWNDWYTLNWNPNPRLPSGGTECPSGINTVRCWDDTAESGLIWAYGAGGDNCHVMCSLVGASPSDFMCDVDSPITNGFDEVASIMTHFDNPYNENDPDEFTCEPGICFGGVVEHGILIQEEQNSNCYVPKDSHTQYACDNKLGIKPNCWGKRFNQVCPCIPGCGPGAGPSCEPANSPFIPPTTSPTVMPTTLSPSTSPTSPTSSPPAEPTSSPFLPPATSPTASPTAAPPTPGPNASPSTFTLSPTPEPIPLGPQTGNLGSKLFSAYPKIRTSGLVWIPDAKSEGVGLLAGVDNKYGRIFMLNPDDDDEYYISAATGKVFRGISFDPNLFATDRHVYVIDEKDRQLFRYSFDLSTVLDHTLTLAEKCATNLSGALPCKDGPRSLTLLSPSSPGVPANFFVGLSDDGVVYRVDATGAGAGQCIDITQALDVTGPQTASQYDSSTGILYSLYKAGKMLAAIDASSDCLLGGWKVAGKKSTGFSIRNNSKAYIGLDVDRASFFIKEFDWTPTTKRNCLAPSVPCTYTACEDVTGGPSACKAPPSSPTTAPLPPTTTPTKYPSSAPTKKRTGLPSSDPTGTPKTGSPIVSPKTGSPVTSPTPLTCTDSLFYYSGKANKNCKKLMKGKTEKQEKTLCNKFDKFGRQVKNHCPKTCFMDCAELCANDADYVVVRIKGKKDVSYNCDAIPNPDVRCNTVVDKQLVGEHCRASCGFCG